MCAADVGESRRRCGRVPAQMWASPGADAGPPAALTHRSSMCSSRFFSFSFDSAAFSSSIVSSRLTTGWFVTFFDLCGKEWSRWLPRLSLRTRLWARRPVPFGTILTPWPCVDDPVVTVGTLWYSRYCGHSGYFLPPAPEVQRVERFGDVCRRRRAVAENGRARVPAERVLSQPMRPSSAQQTASHRPQNATVTVAACERIGAVRRRGRCPAARARRRASFRAAAVVRSHGIACTCRWSSVVCCTPGLRVSAMQRRPSRGGS